VSAHLEQPLCFTAFRSERLPGGAYGQFLPDIDFKKKCARTTASLSLGLKS